MELTVNIDDVHLDRITLRDSIPEEYLHQLQDSIAGDGLLNPITVRTRATGGYSLIAGRCRLLACRNLGWTKIDARVIEPTNGDEIPALGENLIRLQMNPLEEARAIGFLHFDKGMSIRDVAKYTRHGTSWVQDRLMLLNLPENFRKAVADRVLTISAAAQLCLITDEPLRDYYLYLARTNGASVHQCQAWFQIWQGQQTLTQGATDPKPIPRPLEGPPPGALKCWSCENGDPGLLLHQVHLCTDCHKAVSAAIHQPDTQPDPYDPTADAEPEAEALCPFCPCNHPPDQECPDAPTETD